MTTYAYNYDPARISIIFHSPYNSDSETRNSVLAITVWNLESRSIQLGLRGSGNAKKDLVTSTVMEDCLCASVRTKPYHQQTYQSAVGMHGAFHHKHILKYSFAIKLTYTKLTTIVTISSGLSSGVLLQNRTTEIQNRHNYYCLIVREI